MPESSENTPRHSDTHPFHIPLADCRPRGVYRISSRNLTVGVYDGQGGFIGIREKVGSRFLFTEFHFDTGPPFGTVWPRELLGELPDGIELREREVTICTDSGCGRPVHFVEVDRPGHGEWFHQDSSPLCKDARVSSALYQPLFDHLESIEEALAAAQATADADPAGR